MGGHKSAHNRAGWAGSYDLERWPGTPLGGPAEAAGPAAPGLGTTSVPSGPVNEPACEPQTKRPHTAARPVTGPVAEGTGHFTFGLSDSPITR